ncbi:PREDICTED: cilia- and flagella-associated protein 61-like [Branchiostoma belcheri]|uniref:Cilia- and flagella-associated protein 61-like n=1 Tax=Branchiostoma belcheri TaxID=7741 RepID=A0A6P5AJT5_BRABE|nr:PREDICTED: cilia- and flagella-associated protein 61-like [Branchiostoma belcheri]
MTSISSPGGPTEVINARRTESLDAPRIEQLSTSSTEQLFGRVNVVSVIEKANLAVTLCNEQDDILGHAALYDYPNTTEADQAEWQQWLSQNYDTANCTPLNSLFVHYFVARKEYAHGCAQEIIRTIFNAVPDLHFCFLVVPQGVFPEPALSAIFKPMDKMEDAKGPDGCSIFVSHRHEQAPVLHVRKARVEDHDDLTPIFNRQSDVLSTKYGDYFLAELIEAQDDNNHCVIAEVEGTAVGFMSISNEVNTSLLAECFELGPFHGLCTPHPDDILEPPREPTPPPAVPEPSETAPTTADQRPSSAASQASAKSKRSETAMTGETSEATKEAPEKAAAPSPAPSVTGTPQAGKRSSKGSIADVSELKVKPKLSEAHMGESSSSLLSESSRATSVMSEASKVGSVKSAASRAELAPPTTAPDQRSPSPGLEPPFLPPRFTPVYKGGSNAFCIHLFCIDERFEMRSQDFLPYIFSLFPEKDFVVMTVPHLVPEFPLLQNFVRVTPRVPSILAEELYVFHRAGLLKDFVVRPATSEDTSGVEGLVQSVEGREQLLKDLQQYNEARRDPDGTEIQTYVAVSQQQVVGVVILRREENVEYIRSHYNVEDFIYYNHHARSEHGHIHHLALNPIFQHYSKHFLKEVLRLSHKSCLYYPIYPPYAPKEMLAHHSLITALNEMVPVRARRQIVYPLERLGINAPSHRVSKQQEFYAVNHINRKLTLEPKVTINARIVVVGASDVGLSYLETLAFCPHLRFNNITLVSTHGLPGEMAPDSLRDNLLGKSHCYLHEDHSLSSLRSWVNVVFGKMVAINRQTKHVIVAGGTKVPYDHLVLCTGQQYQVPAPTEADINQEEMTNATLPNNPHRRFLGEGPRNVMTVNDSHDAASMLHTLRYDFLNTEGQLIVYGNTLDAYTCVQTVLALGVDGSRIHLVEPPLKPHEPTCFNNPLVEQGVRNELSQAGVLMHSGYFLAQWNDGMGGDLVQSACFTSKAEPLRLECSFFLSFFQKMVDYDAFKAVNDACLVYDGKLVIDSTFHTNDSCIRAAGPLTKFARRYHADQCCLCLSVLIPPPQPIENTNLICLYGVHERYLNNLVSRFDEAVLPGGVNYVHVGKPNVKVSLDTYMSSGDYGRELITGSVEGGDFFRLHINQYRTVETITCYSKQPIENTNLICLYGVHERYLNNLVSRFDEGLIKDFYSYFQEPWCLAIFHDRFSDFRHEVREILLNRPTTDEESLEEQVRQMIDEDLVLSKEQRRHLVDNFKDSGAKRSVETRLLSYLSYNYYHLPMYAKPGMV